jgi:hypothetical protein
VARPSGRINSHPAVGVSGALLVAPCWDPRSRTQEASDFAHLPRPFGAYAVGCVGHAPTTWAGACVRQRKKGYSTERRATTNPRTKRRVVIGRAGATDWSEMLRPPPSHAPYHARERERERPLEISVAAVVALWRWLVLVPYLPTSLLVGPVMTNSMTDGRQRGARC